jgi:hypothetical protein
MGLMRIRAFYDFSVELKNEPQDAVCGWVLRAEIDSKISYCCFVHRRPHAVRKGNAANS